MDEAFRLITLLTSQGKTLVTAESCTGGLLGSVLTDVPGASKVYLGGIISYAYEIKEKLLGVDEGILKEKGAVCAEVAEQMAVGVRRNMGGDYGLSVTGNAGPGTDPLNPNVGEIYIALAWEDGCIVQCLTLKGSRTENRKMACRNALDLLLHHIGDIKCESALNTASDIWRK